MIAVAAGIACGVGITSIFTSCNFCSSKHGDTDTAKVAEEYHADNDIAMNVRSLIDAISVGERLDSANYNFTGILTDGTGRPLYTDVQGTPGAWQIKVLTDSSAVVSNLYLGDLLANDLVQYILTTLSIPDEPLMTTVDETSSNEDEDEVRVYAAGEAFLIFEQSTAKAPNGAEGPLLKIVVRKKGM